jgi:hypothetical protein
MFFENLPKALSPWMPVQAAGRRHASEPEITIFVGSYPLSDKRLADNGPNAAFMAAIRLK